MACARRASARACSPSRMWATPSYTIAQPFQKGRFCASHNSMHRGADVESLLTVAGFCEWANPYAQCLRQDERLGNRDRMIHAHPRVVPRLIQIAGSQMNPAQPAACGHLGVVEPPVAGPTVCVVCLDDELEQPLAALVIGPAGK